LGQLSRLRPFPDLCTPSLLAGGAEWGKKKGLEHCANTVQQWPKHQRVIKTGLVTNPKHDTMPAAMMKIKSIPARPSTQSVSKSK